MADAPGRVILLNGVSSSGKSTLAVELLRTLPTPWFHMSVDMFGAMRGVRQTLSLDGDELTAVLRRTRAGFHRAVAGMSAAGNDVIADHVLSERWRLDDLVRLLAGSAVTFVGVHASDHDIERRESTRADRRPGQGLAQLPRVHAYGAYDVEVNTSEDSLSTCVARIQHAVEAPPEVTAFDRLRAAAAVDESQADHP